VVTAPGITSTVDAKAPGKMADVGPGANPRAGGHGATESHQRQGPLRGL
jgi:hypothetical protein